MGLRMSHVDLFHEFKSPYYDITLNQKRYTFM